MKQFSLFRFLLKVVRVDNGSEFVRSAFEEWAFGKGIELITLSQENQFGTLLLKVLMGSFGKRVNENWFVNLKHAHEIETWRTEYNSFRPDNRFGELTPYEFIEKLKYVC